MRTMHEAFLWVFASRSAESNEDLVSAELSLNLSSAAATDELGAFREDCDLLLSLPFSLPARADVHWRRNGSAEHLHRMG